MSLCETGDEFSTTDQINIKELSSFAFSIRYVHFEDSYLFQKSLQMQSFYIELF